MIAKLIVRMALVLPRGGAKLIKLASNVLPSLRAYPIQLPVAPDITVYLDLKGNVFFPLLKYGCYPHQVGEDIIMQSIIREGDCIIDVGANIGYFGLLCVKGVGSKGIIHCFEPSNIIYPHLEELSAHIHNMRTWQRAISNREGVVYFKDEEMSDKSHIEVIENEANYSVPCSTIDGWAAEIKLDHLDILKVDVEGHDAEVIEGARNSIKKFLPIIEFEAFDLKSVNRIVALLCLDDPERSYRIFRCANRYPVSLIGKEGPTYNWFAIPSLKMSLIPSFLIRQQFLTPWEDGGVI